MPKYRILIAESRYPAHDEEKAVLEPIGAEVILERSDNEDTIAALAADVDGVVVNLAPITAKVVGAMTRCKCVSRYGVGYDNVDTAALKAKGIYLANVPDYCGEDVSDHAMALLMDCVRKVSRKDRLVRQGGWNLTGIQPVHRIAGKTFGFVGYGMIARVLHRKLGGFGLGRVLIADPFVSADGAAKAGAELADLPALCRQADYISIHAPLNDSTRGLIGAAQFAVMKPTAILVNTSRGPLVDEAALIDALKTGKIACAGLDVFTTEPLPADSELRTIENVTLTDHAGWYSVESMVELKTKAAQNVADALTKGAPTYPVKL
ncbi:MAG TPA: C-terminal binding protein [Phycisphaerae bacterium]|nr:C-terminal binding protein [Phycisphaerae bacterium]